MNGLLIVAFVLGCLALAVACLKTLEVGPTIGPAYSPAARVVLLLIVFLALFSVLEVLASEHEMRPGGALLVFIMGAFGCWRVFAAPWQGFLERIWIQRDHRERTPPIA